MTQIPTTDQLRNDIDSGATGEKVGFPDPAAAPLGTDAEAGGNPPTKRERAMEMRARTRHQETPPLDGRIVYGALVGMVGIGILTIAALAG